MDNGTIHRDDAAHLAAIDPDDDGPVWTVDSMAVAPDGAPHPDWDSMSVVACPTRRSFVVMHSCRDFQEKGVHAGAGSGAGTAIDLIVGALTTGSVAGRAGGGR